MTHQHPLDRAYELELQVKRTIALERLAQQQQPAEELNLDPTPEPQANAWKALEEARRNGYQQTQVSATSLTPVVGGGSAWDRLNEARQQQMTDRLEANI